MDAEIQLISDGDCSEVNADEPGHRFRSVGISEGDRSSGSRWLPDEGKIRQGRDGLSHVSTATRRRLPGWGIRPAVRVAVDNLSGPH